MATAANLRTYLMRYVGVQVEAHLTAAPGKNAALLTAANAALSEILQGRQTRPEEMDLRGPTAVTLGAVTAGSRAITFSGFQDWMLGCQIQIAGDPTFHRLVKITSASPALLRPYAGSTASNVSATIWQDVLNLDASIQSVLGPLLLNADPVTLLNSRTDLVPFQQQYNLKAVDKPTVCVISDNLGFNTSPTTSLEFNTRPSASGLLSFTALLTPTRISAWDSDVRPNFLPNNLDETVLFPWARYKLSDDPDFIGNKAEAATAYTEARRFWEAFSTRTGGAESLDIHGV